MRVLRCRLPGSPGLEIETWYRGALEGGQASGAPTQARSLVCPSDQAKDVQLEEEAARASATAKADQTL